MDEYSGPGRLVAEPGGLEVSKCSGGCGRLSFCHRYRGQGDRWRPAPGAACRRLGVRDGQGRGVRTAARDLRPRCCRGRQASCAQAASSTSRTCSPGRPLSGVERTRRSADRAHARGSLIADEERDTGLAGARAHRSATPGRSLRRPLAGASPVSSIRAGKVLADEAGRPIRSMAWSPAPPDAPWPGTCSPAAATPGAARVARRRSRRRAGRPVRGLRRSTGAERGHIVDRALGGRGGMGQRRRRSGCLGRGASLGWPRTRHVRSP